MFHRENHLRATEGDHSHNQLFMRLILRLEQRDLFRQYSTAFRRFTEELITIGEHSRPVCARILVPLKDEDAAVRLLLAAARRLFVSRRD